METSDFPLLSLLIFLPLIAGMALFRIRDERRILSVTLGVAVIELLLSVLLLMLFDPYQDGMQFVEQHRWIPTLNIEYLLGVDGLSVLFVPLTALLTVAVVLASWRSVQTLPRLYFALLLALEGITIGVYCALDLGLFFLFWELTLPPLFFLISLWGIGAQRRYAATKYTLFMLASGVALLFGFILLGLNHANETGVATPAGLSFNYMRLLETPIPLETQSLIFLLLFFGFAVKAPLFPFHVWLPTAAMEGPAGVTALLLGLKLGLFGIIRFAIPLAPQAASQYFVLMVLLGAAGAIYGALVALRQTNLRRMLAFSSISHVGFVLIGVAAFNIQGIQGAVFQLFNFGIIAGGIFLIAGFIQHRLGSTELTALGGAARPMPILASLFFILGLASIGVPGTNGFAAEHLIVIGAFQSHTGMGLAALVGVILGAAYFLAFYQKAFLGPLTQPTVKETVDLRPRERWIAGAMVSLALLLGLFPQGVLDTTNKSLQSWVARLETTPVASDAAEEVLAQQAPYETAPQPNHH
ncbi:proton-translocating NADH-quinone oxidoreductase, chain M [Nitrosococcus halophilus Nc 4]|uniref:NADH-quinone oxidoreductase subunit M n=1 Tax=Nitrosococcus halophilus (strain Nc4) TaxID=472759 RepID=D5BY45_NITHN|nr:NADH-quinone oxidoreductase subunit M [Nitrosococcus halophilus]ADE15956.1 proton-translocating NADH-quinone oxidoreductase, chain M [Nitrosococcus halophilus Nc 4]